MKYGSQDRGGVGENGKYKKEVQDRQGKAAEAAEEWMKRDCSA